MWIGLDWIGLIDDGTTGDDGRRARAIDANTRARTHAETSPVIQAGIMGATLTHPKPIEDLYFGNPVTDAEAFAKAFAPDATLEFIGPYAPKDASGKAVVVPASELRATMANIIAGFSNFTVRARADSLGTTTTTTRDV